MAATTLARTTDPATSHLAAKRATRFISGHCARILDAIAAHPGSCAWEIALAAGFDSNIPVSRRMKALVEAGLVIEGPAKEYGGAFYTTYRRAAQVVRLGEQERLL